MSQGYFYLKKKKKSLYLLLHSYLRQKKKMNLDNCLSATFLNIYSKQHEISSPNYFSIVLSQVDCSSFTLFSQDALATQGLLYFHTNCELYALDL